MERELAALHSARASFHASSKGGMGRPTGLVLICPEMPYIIAFISGTSDRVLAAQDGGGWNGQS